MVVMPYQRDSPQNESEDPLAQLQPSLSPGLDITRRPSLALSTTAAHTAAHHDTSSVFQSHLSQHQSNPNPLTNRSDLDLEPWKPTLALPNPALYPFAPFGHHPHSPDYGALDPPVSDPLSHHPVNPLQVSALDATPSLPASLPIPSSGYGPVHGLTATDTTALQASPWLHSLYSPAPQSRLPSFALASLDSTTGASKDASFGKDSPSSDLIQSPVFSAFNSLAGLHASTGKSQSGLSQTASAPKFRFQVNLHAPTAMLKHDNESPVTYLNKGQIYTLSITDTNDSSRTQSGLQYRTVVRLSFDEYEQRQNPALCWSLWREARGAKEAQQRNGRLQALEYVASDDAADHEDGKSRVQLEASAFDGFSILWTPPPDSPPRVDINLSFGFLSTDFSHAKGVKGIPVRLCAKTHSVSPSTLSLAHELCFCRVKLFRDHGAERKLSNDVAHVKKSIDKLERQIAQAESGAKSRRRSEGGASGSAAKPRRHKRAGSASSETSSRTKGYRTVTEKRLYSKLQSYQDMLTNARSVSELRLQGQEHDDPDSYPVFLPPGEGSSLSAMEGLDEWKSGQGNQWAHGSTYGSTVSSPPSSLSLASQPWAGRTSVDARRQTGWNTPDDGSYPASTVASTSARNDPGSALGGGRLEAMGAAMAYRPPPAPKEAPAACFYILDQARKDSGEAVYHRAIYLMKRTLEELNSCIARKWGLEPSNIARSILETRDGIEIEIDDDVVRELKEGQVMSLRLEGIGEAEQRLAAQDWNEAADGAGDGTTKDRSAMVPHGLVLRLTL